MENLKKNWIGVLVVVLSFIVGIIVYPKMPEMVASHWGPSGEVNGYMGRFWGVFLLPMISFIILLILSVVPKIDPKKNNMAQFRGAYNNFVTVFMLFFFSLYLYTIIWNLGYHYNISKFVSVGFLLLFYFVGDLVGKAKQNYMVGIRTPWTLANENVWNKTHELGGKLFKAAAFLSLVGFFFDRYAIFIIVVPILLVSLYLVSYSYFEYRKESRR